MTFIEWFETNTVKLIVAGLAGSTVSAVMEWEGFLPGVRRIFVGTTAAYFLGPIGLPLFEWAGNIANLSSTQSISAGGFIMGVGGMVVVEIILKAFRLRRDVDLLNKSKDTSNKSTEE